MRIKLTPEADLALSQIADQVLKQNPFIERDPSRWMSAVVVTLQSTLQPKLLEELVERLTTPETARLALLREIEGLSQGMDALALRGLETTLKKFRATHHPPSPPAAAVLSLLPVQKSLVQKAPVPKEEDEEVPG